MRGELLGQADGPAARSQKPRAIAAAAARPSRMAPRSRGTTAGERETGHGAGDVGRGAQGVADVVARRVGSSIRKPTLSRRASIWRMSRRGLARRCGQLAGAGAGHGAVDGVEQGACLLAGGRARTISRLARLAASISMMPRGPARRGGRISGFLPIWVSST